MYWGYVATSGRNSQGVAHKRNLPPTVVTPIPDLRSGLDTPPPSGANFTGNHTHQFIFI